MFFIETDYNDDKIKVDNSWTYGCNRCVVCNNSFKHTRLWWGTGDGIFELRERIGHKSCFKIIEDIKKKKEELLELEFKLFEKKYMIEEKIES